MDARTRGRDTRRKENKTQDVKSKVKVYANDLCGYPALVGEAWPVKG